MADKPQPTVPVVNMNGNTREALKRQHLRVLGCLTAAMEAMGAAAPHGRDYQTQPGLYSKAREEHDARMTAMQAVSDAHYAIALSLRD